MNELTLRAILAGASPDAAEAIDRAVQTGTVFNDNICPVVDIDGDPLAADRIYQKPNGQPFRPTRWEFGSGNCINTWYWVWGIGSDLRDDRLTVDATHTKGGRVYQSKLKKVEGDRP